MTATTMANSSCFSSSRERFHNRSMIIQRFVLVIVICFVSIFKSTFPLTKNDDILAMMPTTPTRTLDRDMLVDPLLSLRSSLTNSSSSSSSLSSKLGETVGAIELSLPGSKNTTTTTTTNSSSNATVTVQPPGYQKPTAQRPTLTVDPTLPNVSHPDYFKYQQWTTLLPQWTKQRQEQKEENKKRIRDKVRVDPETSPRILVVYSGPTEKPINPDILSKGANMRKHKNELYRVNFEHFLRYGVQCRTQDTVVVVTDAIEPIYRKQIDDMHEQCQNDFGTKVMMVVRNSTCYDLESVRRVLHDDDVFTEQELLSYDYFVYANCGTSGPSKLWAELPWTDVFIEPMKLNPNIKMTGLTMNCPSGHPRAHIQSMMFSTSRAGLSLIRDKSNGVVYRCDSHKDGVKSIIVNYELGMSRLLLDHGYAISPIIAPTVIDRHNQTLCQDDARKYHHDIWTTKTSTRVFNRSSLDLDETIFAKTSRIMSEATRQQIGYKYKMNWSW